MGIAALRGLDHFIHDVLRRRLVGIAHDEVDDVLAASARLGLELTDYIEYIGRKALDSGKFVVQGSLIRKLKPGKITAETTQTAPWCAPKCPHITRLPRTLSVSAAHRELARRRRPS